MDKAESRPYYHTNTSPDVFEEHMKILYENKYCSISLNDIPSILLSPNNVNNKYIVITFDDGHLDFYSHAFPVLQKYGYAATVFLPTGYIGKDGFKIKGREHLGWNEVRELAHMGVRFGSHTVTHPQLTTMDTKRIYYEIKHSKESIEDNIGESVKSFSYPYAFPEEDKSFVNTLRNMLQELDFQNGVSTRIGTTHKGDDLFFMKRIPVNSYDDELLFQAKLNGGYDWLNIPQRLSKQVKHNISNLVGIKLRNS